MLQVNNIREHKDAYIEALKKRNFDAESIFDEVLSLDETRRSTQSRLDDTLAESNKLSKQIGLMFKNGEHQKANLLKERITEDCICVTGNTVIDACKSFFFSKKCGDFKHTWAHSFSR